MPSMNSVHALGATPLVARRRFPFLARRWAPVVCALSVAWAVLPAQAQLFGDDEARKAIIDLRERVEVQRRQMDGQIKQLSQDLTRMGEDAGAPTRRALLDLSNQLDVVRQDVARQRGQFEQLARDVADLQRQQKDALVAFDERLRLMEPLKVSLDGQEFRVTADEKAAFEAALELVRTAAFPGAVQAFSAFVKRYPESGYQPSAQFWLGNTLYSTGAYKDAIEAYRRMLQVSPAHLRVPEARLAIANCQLELKDSKSAKRTLEELVKAYPQSDAAVTAKDKLARLR